MSATAAALATLAIVGQSLGTQPVPAVYQGPGDRYSEAGHVFRALDDVDPRTPPLVRRGFRPWRVTHHAAGRVQVYRTARNLPRYTIRVVYAKHGGPAWDRVRIVVRARRSAGARGGFDSPRGPSPPLARVGIPLDRRRQETMSTETAPTFDPSACPECGGPIHEFAYVDTYQRVTLQMDDAGEELEVSDYPTVFETGEDFRDVTYGCRSCCTFGMSLADLLDAHRAKIAA